MRFLRYSAVFFCLSLVACQSPSSQSTESSLPSFRQVSGIYPHLATYNNENECGTGAVVPWANRLWVITYGPHKPQGSSDKLYEITSDFSQIIHEESIGGTPANRMIHPESDQLFIGPYAINSEGAVRTIPYEEMPGRHTGNARHLSDPADKVYYGTMEEGFYEVDVHTLAIKQLYKDGNKNGNRTTDDPSQANPTRAMLAGAHGKGLYSGQGVLVYSNNGEASPEAMKQFDIESGGLLEWDGADWELIRRNQFVEVTGPGGIYGNQKPDTDPIWVTGWDHKSVILGVRSPEKWDFYRLPKASHSYDGAHGWNTEWPRIRDVGTAEKPDYLMTMHGLFWRFPSHFTAKQSEGIRPRSAYLKVIGDFTRWNDQLVFGCDDSAKKEFLNTRKQKGNIEGPGQSNSNLWFTSFDQPDQLGPNTASGAVWLNESVQVNEYSEPFLFAGWPQRSAWLKHGAASAVEVVFEVDKEGNGEWVDLQSIQVPFGEAALVEFPAEAAGEWIRARVSQATPGMTLSFHYTANDQRNTESPTIFEGLATTSQTEVLGGLLYGLGDDRRALGVAAHQFSNRAKRSVGYYELDAQLNLVPKEDTATHTFIQEKFQIPNNVIAVEESSVLVVDDQGRRWRFPLGPAAFTPLTESASLRICREVATERDLFNCHGTFYELPAENADGFAKVRPISSHNLRIHDYASYRGLLVMTGLDPTVSRGEHIIRSEDGAAALWAGAIDDLWKLGKPVGQGGPWKDTRVKAGEASDPYLIGFYDQKSLSLSHDALTSVSFRIEVEPIGHGPWMLYQDVTVKPGETFEHIFPAHFQARWIRFVADKDCRATAWLRYE